MNCKNVLVIGATGSVGSSVLDICERFPDRYRVVGLAAGSNAAAMDPLTARFSPRFTCLVEPRQGFIPSPCQRETWGDFYSGSGALEQLVTSADVDHVVFAASGTATIPALCAALKAGKEVSLANKESIVVAGPWVMPLIKNSDQLRPVDSEHSAIWQCLRDEPARSVSHIWLTASGGPFRNATRVMLESVTPEQALNHPVWPMGAKITIDSATLMNKGIECIEAMQLFSLPASRVGALVHPGSQAHGVVLFEDSSMKMFISPPDMRLPAAAALAWPQRLPLMDNGFEPLLPSQWNLQFSLPDAERFPCFPLALDAGRRGGAYPALLVGADEVAVQAFLEKRIRFMDIPTIIEHVLEKYKGSAPSCLEDAIELVDEGRRRATEESLKKRG